MQALEINISEVLHIFIKTETETSWLQEDVYREVPNEGQKTIPNSNGSFIKSHWQRNVCKGTPFCKRIWGTHSVHPLPFLLGGGGGGLSLQPNFQKAGLDRNSIFRGGLLGKREWLISVGIADFTYKIN